jgi:hypothetical protein
VDVSIHIYWTSALFEARGQATESMEDVENRTFLALAGFKFPPLCHPGSNQLLYRLRYLDSQNGKALTAFSSSEQGLRWAWCLRLPWKGADVSRSFESRLTTKLDVPCHCSCLVYFYVAVSLPFIIVSFSRFSFLFIAQHNWIFLYHCLNRMVSRGWRIQAFKPVDTISFILCATAILVLFVVEGIEGVRVVNGRLFRQSLEWRCNGF